MAVQVSLACGAVEEALEHTAELEKLAAACDVAAVRGFATRSRARVAAALGHGDAVEHLEAALVAFADAGLDHDLAGTRLELAELLADDRPVAAAGPWGPDGPSA